MLGCWIGCRRSDSNPKVESSFCYIKELEQVNKSVCAMENPMKALKFKFLLYLLTSIVFLSACEGDEPTSSSSGTGTTTTTPTSLVVSMTLKDGESVTDTDISAISAVNPGYLTINVSDQDGNPIENQVVSISTSLATSTPATVLTDSSGDASAVLEFLDSLGADTVIATSLLDEEEFSDSISYAVIAPAIQLGDSSGSSFVSGQLEVTALNLSAGGSTSVIAYLVDEGESSFTTPIAVNFSSICAGLATPLATIDEVIVASSGIASATYQAEGCVGEDTVTATAQFGGASFSATGTITVASEVAGSINFISASPESITLKGGGGAGLQETSSLTFQVNGVGGSPLGGQSVTFSVNGVAGGLEFSPTTGISNSNGEVTTVVQSGSIPMVVNIVATVDSSGISTQSTGLVISAGLPDYDSFSLSAEHFNPEAWLYDGVEVEIRVQLADIYNNPPPVGTPVLFTTEGGAIESSCNTNSLGQCTVTWVSGSPRPTDYRTTILAYTQGVESFTDVNGDGYLSDGETITAQLPEAFRDDDEDAIHDTSEFFADFNNDTLYTAADTDYNGNLCNDTSRCSTQTSLNISESLVLTMSDSFAIIRATDPTDTTVYASVGNNQNATLDVSGNSKTVLVNFTDLHDQPLPVGTTIEVGSEVGKLVGETSYTQLSRHKEGDRAISFAVSDAGSGKSGRLTITVETPKGNQTIIHFMVQE